VDRRLRLVGLVLALALPGALLVAAPAADAAACSGTRTWNDMGDHAWGTAANWTPSGPPTATDAVTIPSGTVTGATGSVCDLSVAAAVGVTGTLTVSGAFSAAGGSAFSFADGAGLTLAGTGLASGAVLLTRPAGSSGLTPQVRVEGQLTVAGTVTSERVGLVLPEGGSLVNGDVPGIVTGTGSLSWQGGTLGGSALSVGTPVVVSGGTDRIVLPGARLTLAGDTSVTGARLVLGSQAQLTIAGVATLSGPGVGVGRGTHDVVGQQLTVAAGAALQRVGNAGVDSVLDVPVVNRGAITISGQLTAPFGFRQEQQADTEITPVTGLLGTTALLTTRRTDGSYGVMNLAAGGIGGVGTVATRRLTLGDGWVHPGFAAVAGTLNLTGDLVLSKTSELQLYVRGLAADKRDVLAVTPLTSNGTQVAGGRATLAGQVTALNGPGFTPTYGTKITGVLRYTSRTGAFTAPLRPITPSGLGWAPGYDDNAKGGRAVDLTWRDVQPPSVGLAGVPAFTQAASQRVIYEAVDNRSGVRSYDVRWRSGVPTGSWGRWHRPTAWQTTKVGSQTLRGLRPGTTYCIAARARDRLGNLSAWSRPQCVTRMADDRSLALRQGWARVHASGVSGGSVTRASTAGATLVRRGKVTRIALVVVRCPGCGTLGVYRGTTLVKTLSLKGPAGLHSWVSRPFAQPAGPVRLRVMSSGRPVALDSVGFTR
jgi:hypothetical protein